MLGHVDKVISARILRGELLTTPASLTPLPLAGVPGWWPGDEQRQPGFYADLQVFRPAPRTLVPAPVNEL
jgi:hypothetical protein